MDYLLPRKPRRRQWLNCLRTPRWVTLDSDCRSACLRYMYRGCGQSGTLGRNHRYTDVMRGHMTCVLLLERCQPRWLSSLRRSHVHSLMIARRSLCPEKLGSNPGHGSKGINFSGWHGLDMFITVAKRR